MRHVAHFLACFLISYIAAHFPIAALADDVPQVGAVSTSFHLTGDDKVIIERYDDPKVANVSCYVSRAIKGGIMASIGLAENPSRFSVACRATGPVKIIGTVSDDKEGEIVFATSTSPFFKEMRISRFYDKTKNVLVYLVWSTKLIDGSPFNSISAVPIN